MRTWPLILGVLFALADIPPALADVSGPACVTDGNVIVVNGRRWYGKCIGGTPVRLFGTIAPDLAQLCDAPDGRKWQCGRAAAAMLLDTLKNETVMCEGTTVDSQGRLMAVCRVQGEEINRKMVRDGWALAYARHSMKYLPEEKMAEQARKGLWQSSKGERFAWRDQ